MGTEEELAKHYVAFKGFTVDAAIMKLAPEGPVDGRHSPPLNPGTIWTPRLGWFRDAPEHPLVAENRMWTQMGVLS